MEGIEEILTKLMNDDKMKKVDVKKVDERRFEVGFGGQKNIT